MNLAAPDLAASAACWNCQAPVRGEHFCPACGKVQPLPPRTDYFSLLGLPPRLALDSADLEQRFLQLSWKLHPDNFVCASEFEQNISLERSARLNDAYRTLRDPVRRVEYVLALAGMRKEGQTKQQAPPELLEEVFELNEALDELRAARRTGGDARASADLRARLEGAQKHFEEKLREVDEQLAAAAREWDALLVAQGDAAAQRRIMERMNEILNRRSYVRNLLANVQSELAEA